MRQGNLFDAVCSLCKRPAHPGECIPTKAPKESRKRVSAQALKILERFRMGPLTTNQLSGLARQYNARIKELRDAGYKIVLAIRSEGGNNTYELRGEPE